MLRHPTGEGDLLDALRSVDLGQNSRSSGGQARLVDGLGDARNEARIGNDGADAPALVELTGALHDELVDAELKFLEVPPGLDIVEKEELPLAPVHQVVDRLVSLEAHEMVDLLAGKAVCLDEQLAQHDVLLFLPVE